jgi:hypothetical protein
MGNRFAIFLVTLVWGLAISPLVLASTTFTYQGKLNQGATPFSGTADLQFELYPVPEGPDAPIGVNLLSDHPIENGLFQVELDFGDVFDGSDRYLAVLVDGELLGPRQQIHAVPMAMHALNGSRWSMDSSSIYFNSGGVGIGTSTPSASLQVVNSAIFGHSENTAVGLHSFVSGGADPGTFTNPNNAAGDYSFVAGGFRNSASGDGSFVGGGFGSSANGTGSIAMGTFAIAEHTGTFVWNGTGSSISSSAPNQFIVNPAGGAGFGTVPTDFFEIGAAIDEPGEPGFGHGAFRVHINGNTRLRLHGNGGLAVGSSYNASGVPENGLRVQGHAILHSVYDPVGTSAPLCRTTDGGHLTSCSSSSARYKRDIADIDQAGELLARLRPVSFRWRTDGSEDFGLIAEEVAEIEPRLVLHDADGRIDGVKYRYLGPLLIKAYQEQQRAWASRDAEIAALKEQLVAQHEEMTQRLAVLEHLLIEENRQLAGGQP